MQAGPKSSQLWSANAVRGTHLLIAPAKHSVDASAGGLVSLWATLFAHRKCDGLCACIQCTGTCACSEMDHAHAHPIHERMRMQYDSCCCCCSYTAHVSEAIHAPAVSALTLYMPSPDASKNQIQVSLIQILEIPPFPGLFQRKLIVCPILCLCLTGPPAGSAWPPPSPEPWPNRKWPEKNPAPPPGPANTRYLTLSMPVDCRL